MAFDAKLSLREICFGITLGLICVVIYLAIKIVRKDEANQEYQR